jgi:structural maintenance of chromosome 1
MPSYHINTLTLTDFKSYRGTHTIGPFPTGFVTVIGANGSGKSNVLDAISFVLGADARRLRGDNLRRLVSLGGTSAKVELTLSSADSFSGGLAQIARMISMTSTASMYFVNDLPTTAAAYRAFLRQDLGLEDPSELSPYLVFQGDAENLASQTGHGLARLVDAVSGSAALAEQYNGLAAAKDRAEDRMRLVTLKRRQLLTDRKQMTDQQKLFSAFETLRAKKERFVRAGFLKRLEVLSDKVTAAEAELHKLCSPSAGPAAIQVLTTCVDATRQARAALEMRKLKVERDRDVVKAKLGSLTLRLAERRTEKKFLALKQERLLKKKEEVCAVGRDVESKLSDIDGKRRALEEFLAKEKTKHKEASIEGRLTPEQRQALNGLRTEVACMTSDLDGKKKTAVRELKVQKADEERIKEKQDEMKKEHDCMTARVDRDFSRLNGLEREMENVALTKNQLLEKVEKAETEISQMRRRESFLKDERSRIVGVLGCVKENEIATKKQAEISTFVDEIKRIGESKVLGVLRTLVKPTQKRYEQSVTVGLRKFLDAIIVVDTGTAVSVVKRAKERRRLQISVVALDGFNGGTHGAPAASLPAGCRYLRDCVTGSSGAVLNLVRSMAGDTLVAESLEIARDAAFSSGWGFKKVITLDGTKVHRSGIVDVQEASTLGSISFGSVAESRNKLDSVDKELTSLSHSIDVAKDQIIESSDELRKLELDTMSARANVHVARGEYERRQQTLRSLEADLDDLKSLRSNASLADIQTRIASLDAERKTRVESLCNDFLALVSLRGVFDWQAVAEHPDYTEFDRRMSKISDQIATLQVESNKLQVSRESQVTLLVEIQRNIDELDANFRSLTGDELEFEFEKLQTDTMRCQTQVDATLSERETVECKFREESENLAKLRREEEQRSSRVAALNTEISCVNFRAQEILSKAQVEGVDLIDWRNLDLSEVRRQTPERIQQELIAVEAELEATAAVHAPATNALAEAEQRVIAEWEDAKKDFTTVTKSLDEVKMERKGKFDECTTFIATRLAEYYDILSDEGSSNLLFEGILVGQTSSRAFLDVEVPEEPWRGGLTFRAMPPGKRLTEIASLSGGERTMASTALLFSLAAWSGTKFVVVDELDAALDKHNVVRLVNFVKHLNIQVIAISLKEDVYARSDALVGVWRGDCSSNIACLDLSAYVEASVRA